MKTHTHEFDGTTYLIERDPQTIGYNSATAKWNLDNTPRCRTGWSWSVSHNGCWMPLDQWASSLKNAKLAIEGKDTGDIAFA